MGERTQKVNLIESYTPRRISLGANYKFDHRLLKSYWQDSRTRSILTQTSTTAAKKVILCVPPTGGWYRRWWYMASNHKHLDKTMIIISNASCNPTMQPYDQVYPKTLLRHRAGPTNHYHSFFILPVLNVTKVYMTADEDLRRARQGEAVANPP